MKNFTKWVLGLLLVLTLIGVSDMSAASDGLERVKSSGSIAAETYGLEGVTACIAGYVVDIG